MCCRQTLPSVWLAAFCFPRYIGWLLRVFRCLHGQTPQNDNRNLHGNGTFWGFFFFFTVEIDAGFYTIKFDSLLLKDVVVEADSIIPPLREEDPPSSDSDVDEAENGDYDAYAKGQFGSSELAFAFFSLL